MQSAWRIHLHQPGYLIERLVHGGIASHITEQMIYAKQTAPVAIHSRKVALTEAAKESMRILLSTNAGARGLCDLR
jgi:hypothetical protein